MHFYVVYNHHKPGQILVKNLSNDEKILDKLKFVNLTTQTIQNDKFGPVFDYPITRKILCDMYRALRVLLSCWNQTWVRSRSRLWLHIIIIIIGGLTPATLSVDSILDYYYYYYYY